ncbi:hypothetical protein Tco_0263295 [Tanacetum coccineum]
MCDIKTDRVIQHTLATVSVKLMLPGITYYCWAIAGSVNAVRHTLATVSVKLMLPGITYYCWAIAGSVNAVRLNLVLLV